MSYTDRACVHNASALPRAVTCKPTMVYNVPVMSNAGTCQAHWLLQCPSLAQGWGMLCTMGFAMPQPWARLEHTKTWLFLITCQTQIHHGCVYVYRYIHMYIYIYTYILYVCVYRYIHNCIAIFTLCAHRYTMHIWLCMHTQHLRCTSVYMLYVFELLCQMLLYTGTFEVTNQIKPNTTHM